VAFCFSLKSRSHQKRCDLFAQPNPMKSQRTEACGCDRCDIFPGGAFGATRFRPLKYFNFEAVISQLGPISSRVAPRIIAVPPLLNQNKTDNNVMSTITYIIYYNVKNTITSIIYYNVMNTITSIIYYNVKNTITSIIYSAVKNNALTQLIK